MRRAIARALGVAMLLGATWAASGARAEAQRRVPVQVVEVSGDRAYVQPGASDGVRLGTTVRIGRRNLEVVAATAQYAAVIVGDDRPDIGARGVAVVRATEERGAERLTPPRPLRAFRGQWPEPRRPSETQNPDRVPLGESLASRKLRLSLSTAAALIAPTTGRGDAVGWASVRARVHAEPFEDVPFSVDADAALQIWAASNLSSRAGASSQPWVRVRELRASYGDETDFFASLGRLRYAASTIGQLDGLRIQTPSFDGFTIGAFGGFVPDPLEGKPLFDAARFGLEAAFRLPDTELRPMVFLVGSGSVFDGQLDERRLSGVVSLYPGESRIGGHFEVSLFDSDNPWNAGEVELTAAGIDGTLRIDDFHIGARADMRRPERSLWLASYLPADFLCARTPGAPGTPSANETCSSQYEPRYLGALDAGLEIGRFAVAAGGTLLYVGEQDELDQLGGWLSLRAVRILDVLHADLSGMVSTGALIETFAGRVELGVSLFHDALDVSAHYRPSLTRYHADTDRFVDHMAGGSLRVSPSAVLDVTLDVDFLAGRDMDAMVALAGVTWRPELL